MILRTKPMTSIILHPPTHSCMHKISSIYSWDQSSMLGTVLRQSRPCISTSLSLSLQTTVLVSADQYTQYSTHFHWFDAKSWPPSPSEWWILVWAEAPLPLAPPPSSHHNQTFLSKFTASLSFPFFSGLPACVGGLMNHPPVVPGCFYRAMTAILSNVMIIIEQINNIDIQSYKITNLTTICVHLTLLFWS